MQHIGLWSSGRVDEALCQSSVGRAYYALLNEVVGALRRWGFGLPPRDKPHTFARLKFVYATNPDLKRIRLTVESLGRLRNAADHQIGSSDPFVLPTIAIYALTDAESAIALLDANEADPARRAGAVRTIPYRSRPTTASASNKASVVKPIDWPRAVDPAGGVELPLVTTDAIVRAAEFWAMVRQSGIPTPSPDVLDADAILVGQAALAGRYRHHRNHEPDPSGQIPRHRRPELGPDSVNATSADEIVPRVKPKEPGFA